MLNLGQFKERVLFLVPTFEQGDFGEELEKFTASFTVRCQVETWRNSEQYGQSVEYTRQVRRIRLRADKRISDRLKACMTDGLFHVIDIQEIDNRRGYTVTLQRADIEEVPLVSAATELELVKRALKYGQ